MQFFCNFNKKTSTAVPLWNERYEEILKCANIKEKKYQNYSKLFFLRVLFIGSEYIRVMVEQYELARYK